MEGLRDTIQRINRVWEREEDIEKAEIEIKKILEEYFTKLPSMEIFVQICDRLFSGTVNEYVYFMSLCFWVRKEKLFLDKIAECILYENNSWDYTLAIEQQMGCVRFRNAYMDNTYREKRELQSELVRRFRNELNRQIDFIPFEKRNKGRILLTTDTILSSFHAPTQIVLEVAETLQENLGYEVMIGVHVVKTPSNIENLWYHPIVASYLPELNYASHVTYHENEYSVYQQIVDCKHVRGIRRYIDIIKEFNPAFIWHIGGDSILTEILTGLTTVVAMPCTQGYAASDAQVLAAYLTSDKKKLEEMETYIKSKNQRMITIKMVLPRRVLDTVFRAGDFGFSEEDFLIAIVGNRLNSEINLEFIQVMQRIAGIGRNIRFVIVGKHSIDWKQHGLYDIVCNYGYCTELRALLRGVDLFLNPKRQGGAGGSGDAIYVGTPVCTLPACDVADNGEAFVCQDYDDMVAMVKRYYEDRAFYNAQVEECHKIRKEWDRDTIPENGKILVRRMLHWLENGDIQ